MGTIDLTANAVANQISGVPTVADVAMRLKPLDDATLAAVVKSDPDGFKQWAADGQSLAQYLRDLAETFDGIAGRVVQAGGAGK